MDIAEIKKIANKLGAVLVMDGDRPSFVVLSYEAFKNMEAGMESDPGSPHFSANNEANQSQSPADNTSVPEDILEKLNEEILLLKEEIRQKEEAELVEDLSNVESRGA